MNTYIQKLKKTIEPLRAQIINHKVYASINTLRDLQIFMQYHVFAVWDFMSLLKALQNNLTCTSVPWFPKGDGITRHLINEIVVAEESDIDHLGNRKSHFELYCEAMMACGADTSCIDTFIATLKDSDNFNTAFTLSNTPPQARDFVTYTFEVIQSNKDYLQSAVFTFGREDLIPKMFISMVNDMRENFEDNRLSIFKYYLERHIEIDGDEHSHLALQMTANLCGNNEQAWHEATQATLASLQKRILLWDGAYEEIKRKG